jgi:two-component system sensor histidine kinase DesK
MRLLPPKLGEDLGYTPYVWLVYAVPFAADPFWRGDSGLEIAATLAGLAAFLWLYFAGYRQTGRALAGSVAGLAALGVAFTPVNVPALSFFIYAGAHAARLGTPRRALAIIVAIGLVGLATALAARLPLMFGVVALAFPLLIGGANVHFTEVGRKNRALRAAREEVERIAKVAERERIARDLHDLLGHTLSVIVLKSELASKLAERDPARAIREIRDVERVSRQALAEVRAAVTGYRASIGAEVERARAALTSAGVAFETELEPLPLSVAQEDALAFAVREALTNVLRHARARRCRLRVAREGACATLAIEDDGVGGTAAEGFGLTSMRERLAAVGATLERRAAGGTRLVISLPLTEAA